jgi:hypothetical protein
MGHSGIQWTAFSPAIGGDSERGRVEPRAPDWNQQSCVVWCLDRVSAQRIAGSEGAKRRRETGRTGYPGHRAERHPRPPLVSFRSPVLPRSRARSMQRDRCWLRVLCWGASANEAGPTWIFFWIVRRNSWRSPFALTLKGLVGPFPNKALGESVAKGEALNL